MLFFKQDFMGMVKDAKTSKYKVSRKNGSTLPSITVCIHIYS